MHNLDQERSREGLKQTAVSGFKWAALAHGVRLVVHFVTTAILATLLVPEDFGLVAMAMVVVGLVYLFRDFGAGAAIVDQAKLDHETASTLFWANVLLGAALSGLVALSAPLVAMAYREPHLTPVLQMLGFSVLLGSLGVVPHSLLQRRLRFKVLARIEILALVAGGATGVSMAILGRGVWALVYQTLVTIGSHSAMVLLCGAFVPSLAFRRERLRGLRQYGLHLAGFDVVHWFTRNIDQLLVGVVLGVTALGYYALACRLLLHPIQGVSAVVSRVAVPIYARIRNDHARMRNAHLKLTGAVAMLMFPAMVGMVLVCQPMVVSFLGPEWLPMLPLIGIFALVGMLHCMGSTAAPIFRAKGRTDLMFRWGVLVAAVTGLACGVGLLWGVLGVACAYALATLAMAWPGLHIPCYQIGLPVKELGSYLLPALKATGAMAVCTLAARLLVAFWLEPEWQLVVVIATGVVTYVAASLLWNRRPILEVRNLLLGRA